MLSDRGGLFMPVFRFRFLLVLLAGGFFAHPAASDTAAIIPIHLLIVFHTSLVLPEIVKNRRLVSCCMSCCIFLKKGFFCETFSRGKKESFPKTGKKNRINTDFFSIHAVLTIGPPGGIRTPGLQNRNLLRYPASPRADTFRCIRYYSTGREKMQGGAFVFFGVFPRKALPLAGFILQSVEYKSYYTENGDFIPLARPQRRRVYARICGQTKGATGSSARNYRPSCTPKCR